MERLRSINWKQVSFVGVGLLVFIYIIARAYHVAPYQDEVSTFFLYVQSGNVNPYEAHLDANNHVLNSLLSNWSYRLLGGTSFLAIRLPSVLSFLVLFGYLFHYTKLFSSSFKALWFKLGMITCFYTISFFSLARGYGMSYAFLIASLYHLYRLNSEKDKSLFHLTLGGIMGGLALWSNLSLLLLIMCMTLFFLVVFLSKRRSVWQGITIWLLLTIPLIYAVDYLFLLKSEGMLYLGESSDLFGKSIFPLLRDIYEGAFFRITVYVLIIASSVWSIFHAVKTKKLSNSGITTVLFWSAFLGIILSHEILGIKYPVDRALFHLFLLGAMGIHFSLDLIRPQKTHFIGLAFALPFLIQLLMSYNLVYAPLWRPITMPASFVYQIKWNSQEDQTPLIMAAPPLEYTYNHYNIIKKENLNVAQVGEYSEVADFLILSEWSRQANMDRYELIDSFPACNAKLLKRKVPVHWEIHDSIVVDTSILIKQAYTEFKPIWTDKYVNESFRIDLSADIELGRVDADISFVLELRSYTEEKLIYLPFDLKRIQSETLMTRFSKSFFIEKITGDSKYIFMYIWSPEGDIGQIDDLRINISRAQVY